MLTLTDINQITAGRRDAKLILAIVNGYIRQKGVVITGDVPEGIKLAGIQLAKAYIDGTFLAGRDEGVVVSKSSKAGEVSVSKTYKDGIDGQAVSREQMIADTLLAPYIKGVGLNMMVNRG